MGVAVGSGVNDGVGLGISVGKGVDSLPQETKMITRKNVRVIFVFKFSAFKLFAWNSPTSDYAVM